MKLIIPENTHFLTQGHCSCYQQQFCSSHNEAKIKLLVLKNLYKITYIHCLVSIIKSRCYSCIIIDKIVISNSDYICHLKMTIAIGRSHNLQMLKYSRYFKHKLNSNIHLESWSIFLFVSSTISCSILSLAWFSDSLFSRIIDTFHEVF